MERRLHRLVLAAAIVAFLLLLLVRAREVWVFTVDDTFITLRYAKHLAQGLGPTWNPGGPHVEGYTTALWMLVLSLAEALGIDGHLFAKGAGLLFACLSVAAAAFLARELSRDLSRRAQLVAEASPYVLGALFWPVALHAVSGMETTFAAFLLTCFFALAIRAHRSPSPAVARALAITMLLCPLTRPEAVLPCAVTWSLLLWRGSADARRSLVRSAALWAVLPGVLYFVTRALYFGLLLPLPFYVKATGQPFLDGLEEVTEFFEPFVVQHPGLSALFLLAAVRMRDALSAPLAGALAFAVFFAFPSHIMGFQGRYLFPIFPFLAATIGVGAAIAVQWAEARAQRSHGARAAVLVGAILTAVMTLPVAPFPELQAEVFARWIRYGTGLQRAHIGFAHRLHALRARVAKPVIALLDVGAVGYYSEWTTIDTLGLNDTHVAFARAKDVGYVFSHAPELLVLVSEQADRYVQVFDWETPLHAGAVARGYQLVHSYEFLVDYHLLVFAKPGSPIEGRSLR